MTPSVARKKAEASDFHLSKTGKRGELIQARWKYVWVKFGGQFAIRLSGRSCHKISVRWSLSVHKKLLSPGGHIFNQIIRYIYHRSELYVKCYLSMHKKCFLPVIQPGFRAEIFYREHKALKDEVGWHCRKSPCSMLLLMDSGRRWEIATNHRSRGNVDNFSDFPPMLPDLPETLLAEGNFNKV